MDIEAQAPVRRSTAALNDARTGQIERQGLGESLNVGRQFVDTMQGGAPEQIADLSKQYQELLEMSLYENLSDTQMQMLDQERTRLQEQIAQLSGQMPTSRETLEIIAQISPQLAELMGFSFQEGQ
jgi:hypothetical protein